MSKVAIAIAVLVSLFAIGTYALLWLPGYGGYGYAGHGGYHRGPSMFYWGGVNTYHSPSVRTGSRSGPGLRGGGLHGGK
jgi:hypothetical protein